MGEEPGQHEISIRDIRLYVDTVLPFGLWSALNRFNTLAGALVDFRKEQQDLPDDYQYIGGPDSLECNIYCKKPWRSV